MPIQRRFAEPDRGFHRARVEAARLGDAEVDRRVGRVGQRLVGGGGEKHVRRLAGDLELVEVVVLKDPDVVETALDHRLGTGFAVFLQKVLLEAACVHADADGAAVVLRGADHFAHPFLVADVAGVDAKAGRARLGGLDGAPVVGSDVGRRWWTVFSFATISLTGREYVEPDGGGDACSQCRPRIGVAACTDANSGTVQVGSCQVIRQTT